MDLLDYEKFRSNMKPEEMMQGFEQYLGIVAENEDDETNERIKSFNCHETARALFSYVNDLQHEKLKQIVPNQKNDGYCFGEAEVEMVVKTKNVSDFQEFKTKEDTDTFYFCYSEYEKEEQSKSTTIAHSYILRNNKNVTLEFYEFFAYVYKLRTFKLGELEYVNKGAYKLFDHCQQQVMGTKEIPIGYTVQQIIDMVYDCIDRKDQKLEVRKLARTEISAKTMFLENAYCWSVKKGAEQSNVCYESTNIYY
jgi:hypothetical protein